MACLAPKIQFKTVSRLLCYRRLQNFLCGRDDVIGSRRNALPLAELPHMKHNGFNLKCFDSEFNEHMLWHGTTSMKTVEQLCTNGLDPQRGGSAHGATFGVGSYFAPHFSKSDLYTKPYKGNKVGDRCILLCRVIAGSAYHAKKPCQRNTCPPDNPNDGQQFDSILGLPKESGGCVDVPEVVLFRDTRVLPMYVVTYSHMMACKCCTCKKQFPEQSK